MSVPIEIPNDEQLRALAGGLVEVYTLIERYTGSSVSTDFRKFITVTKPELIAYLRQNPGIAEKHVMPGASLAIMHDLPALYEKGAQWAVSWMDHGRETNEQTYASLEEAAANYLMAYW